MATEREISDQHEAFIAKLYRGQVTRNSGAGDREKADVCIKDEETLIECKRKGAPGQNPKGKPQLVKHMEKVAREAYEEGREPALALRYFDPSSPLASKLSGYVDMTVRLVQNDVARSERLRDLENFIKP